MDIKDRAIKWLGGYTDQEVRIINANHKGEIESLAVQSALFFDKAARLLAEGPRFTKIVRTGERFVASNETRELIVSGLGASVTGTMAVNANVWIAPWSLRCYVNVDMAEEG